jgi:hypothetical protein
VASDHKPAVLPEATDTNQWIFGLLTFSAGVASALVSVCMACGTPYPQKTALKSALGVILV